VLQRLSCEGKEAVLLADEVPHVSSSKLKISWQDAADMMTTVRGGGECVVVVVGG